MIISRTPLRVSLGGGGTDLPSYSSKYGGMVLSATIDKYTFITLNRRKLDSLIRASYSKTEIVDSVEEIEHNIIREALKLTGVTSGVEITSISDLPTGSGMGGSGAFVVGLLNALHAYCREHASPHDLAEEACHIEMNVLGEPIGKHDQYLAAFGGIRVLDIDETGNVSTFLARISEDVLEELEQRTFLFYTGIVREGGEVLEAQNSATLDGNSRVIESLHRIKDIGWEIKEALEDGELGLFGNLLDRHWRVKRNLSHGVSTSMIDEWYEAGKADGALGGKIIGAGGGGFLMFYCEENPARLRETMASVGLREMRFRFEMEGSKVIFNL